MWLLLLLPRTLIDPEYEGEEEEAKPAGQLIEFSTFSLLIFLSLPSFFQFDLQVSAILIGIQFQCERRERRRRRSNSLLKESHAHTHAHTYTFKRGSHAHRLNLLSAACKNPKTTTTERKKKKTLGQKQVLE